MDAGDQRHLISVNKGLLRHPVAVGAGAAALVALLVLNALAFVRGLESPWLFASVIIADMVVIGVGVLVAAREVMTAEQGTVAVQEELASIVEWSDDAIISQSLDGVIRSWNRGAERMYGYSASEAIGQHISLMTPQESLGEQKEMLARIARGETLSHFETVRRAKDGHRVDVSLTISPIRDPAGRIVGASKIARDMTGQRLVHAKLSAAQARLEAIVDSAMDAVITVDEAQNIVLFNRAAEEVFRVPRAQALGQGLDRFIPQRFRAAHRPYVERFGATGITSRRMGDVTTLWGLRADGTEFPLEASISQVGEGGQRFYTVILRDITVRKQHEDELRRSQQELRELSARVLEAREEEKTLIARELHDELGQLLTALKMDLSWLRERVSAEPEVAKKAAEMNAMLDQTVSATRRISANLRPLMLDDLGLADAAAWLVDEFGKRSGIECSYRQSGDGVLDEVSKPVATTMYRALQESLTNIGRHAGAKNAWVALGVERGLVSLEVEDDGRGIAVEDITKARSLGLKGMRERVTYLGGSFEVSRAARGGTRVRVTVPPQAAPEPKA
ncbi:MAG TPA: PAS domain S-box protein [Burkholderiales bacterium]|nr:PAS domain S-box protein [Burkholderiales bacterium]